MLSKTIKLGFSLLIATMFLAGCASTSQPTDTDSSVTTASSASASTSQSSGQQEAELGSVFYFEFDQSTLTAATRALLIAHAADLKTYPRNIRLEGHADERGTREYNMALGERRAMAVRDYLVSEGVATPIEVVSYGEEQPTSSGGFEAAWSLDRRVEIK
jgi:peptidoglycan-associated lipoprotein